MIGGAGLTTALHAAGYTLTDRSPDYVILGETRTYSVERITQAIRLVSGGARFIATNPDATGPTVHGPVPATGAVAALISRATGSETVLVLTDLTAREDAERFPYRAARIVDSVADLLSALDL